MAQSNYDQPVSSQDVSSARTTEGSGTVKGRVTLADGKPTAAAAVAVVGSLHPDIAALTNERGEYSLDLDPGSYDVIVTASGYPRSTKKIVVAKGETTRCDFVLSPNR